MVSLGKIKEFNPTSTNITRYLERLEQYFEGNDVPTDTDEVNKRRPIIISAICAKTYDVLSNLCLPHSPSKRTLNSF